MNQLSGQQTELISSLAKRLGVIGGVKAVVLGGSYARGRAEPGSDIDLGLFYSEMGPFSIQSIRELAEEINDTESPVVTDFYGWGPWVSASSLRPKLAGMRCTTFSSRRLAFSAELMSI